jgi:glycosyltransferase involved in cell wall biosynthesis
VDRTSVHIAIDAIGAKSGGAATVALEVVRAALDSGAIRRVSVFSAPAALRAFEWPNSSRLRIISHEAAERSPLSRLSWQLAGFSLASEHLGADATLGLSNGGSRAGRLPGAIFLQQSLPFFEEGMMSFGTRSRIWLSAVRAAMHAGCSSANLVLVQTSVMRECVIREFAIPPERVHVYLPSASLARRQSPCLPCARMLSVPEDRRILYVGGSGPYKNLEILVAALPGLRRRLPGLTLFVTLAAEHALCATEGVVGLGYLSGPELTEAYEEATALVMPSLVETVGLPLLEAMSVGTPVLAADRPYAREVCRTAAEFFDPRQPKELEEIAHSLLSDKVRLGQLRLAGMDRTKNLKADRPYGRMIDDVLGLVLGKPSTSIG